MFKHYLKEATLSLGLVSALLGCKAQNNDRHHTAELNRPPVIVVDPPVKQKQLHLQPREIRLSQQVDDMMKHIKTEINAASAAGKPPLILLLEDHMNRESLAKELALAARLKQDHGVSDLLVEFPHDQFEDNQKAAKVYANTMRMLMEITESKDAKLTAADRDTLQKIRMKYEKFQQETYNMAVLSDVASSLGINTQFASYPPDIRAKGEDQKISDAAFVDELANIDQYLLSALGKLPKKPRLMVVGGMHGSAIAGQAKDYHVIPIALSKLPEMGNMLRARMKIVELKQELGKPLSDDEKPLADILARDHFYITNALQAATPVGINTLSDALSVAGSQMPPDSIPEYWKTSTPEPAMRIR